MAERVATEVGLAAMEPWASVAFAAIVFASGAAAFRRDPPLIWMGVLGSACALLVFTLTAALQVDGIGGNDGAARVIFMVVLMAAAGVALAALAILLAAAFHMASLAVYLAVTFPARSRSSSRTSLFGSSWRNAGFRQALIDLPGRQMAAPICVGGTTMAVALYLQPEKWGVWIGALVNSPLPWWANLLVGIVLAISVAGIPIAAARGEVGAWMKGVGGVYVLLLLFVLLNLGTVGLILLLDRLPGFLAKYAGLLAVGAIMLVALGWLTKMVSIELVRLIRIRRAVAPGSVDVHTWKRRFREASSLEQHTMLRTLTHHDPPGSRRHGR